MRIIYGFLVGLSLAATAEAADIQIPSLRVGSDVYSNLTIISVTATDVNFMHSRGVANAKLKDLSPGWQKFFHYDAGSANGAQSEQLQSNSSYQQQTMAAKPARAQAAPQADDSGDDVEIHVPRLYAKSFLNGPAPAFVVDQWLTPKPGMSGKFVLIDFWATWCGPCRRSIPHLNELYEKFGDKVAFVGLTDQSGDAVQAMTSPTIEYAVASDPEKRMMRDAEVRGIPHAILIDPKGIVRFEGMPEFLTAEGLGRILAKYGS